MENREYFFSLDIGTDSVGYAVSDENYDLKKFKGEPIWGVETFEDANLSEERRSFRTARRRLDRKQHRIDLLSEIFAHEICIIDPNFFIRRKESALFPEDTTHGVQIFDRLLTDKEYHVKYPTIHHLIYELMTSDEPHDVRLVYLACAWLVANRGHFLYDTSLEKINDFNDVYNTFKEYLDELGWSMPWDEDIDPMIIKEIMQMQTGVKAKETAFTEKIYNGKRAELKKFSNDFYSIEAIIKLLSGGTIKPKDIFKNDEYSSIDSITLSMDEDNFARILSELGDDAELLRILRTIFDHVLLSKSLNGKSCISEAKIEVYEQHKKDLSFLKHFIRTYKKSEYYSIFRSEKGLYTSYSYNVKSCAKPQEVKKISKESFCKELLKKVRDVSVEPEDEEKYKDMLKRLELSTFLPKQKDSDNRVIPHQLYAFELSEILKKAKGYLPMLSETDQDGITTADRILAIFNFRIPYFVGPLNKVNSKNAWVVRKEGKIYPWNFEKMVDFDASEQAFINRMTNSCTYLPGEEVLPSNSLLYSKFTVLNELNNLKINQHSIDVSVKQELYTELFLKGRKKVTLKSIRDYLLSHGYTNSDDEISGIDIQVNSNLKPWHSFGRLMDSGVLTEQEVEEIIRRAAYSEDKGRMSRYLKNNFPQLSDDDVKYIIGLKLKGFGRLSEKLLTEIYHVDENTGAAKSIMEAMWDTNENLMQLLSVKYTFRKQIDDFADEYYSAHPHTLNSRLDDMYISNAVKRPIFRTLDITSEVVKAMGCPPKKIFVEMARGGKEEQRGKRTESRKQQLLNLYKSIKSDDARRLEAEINAMGSMADNRLQSDKLFLYYTQMGKCMYTGQPIELASLASAVYNIDHIYPRAKTDDNSVLNNKVLVLSVENGDKKDVYPIGSDIRVRMRPFWDMLHNNGLITDEKYRRLIRSTPFTEDELHGFINRQLVETRQSTKAVAQLLKERYPDTEIVYVKAGLVTDFRRQFTMLKSRAVNDLHHAKDAYLNIVVGNVYHEKFTKSWFNVNEPYNLNVERLFSKPVVTGGRTVWNGSSDIDRVRKVMSKNAVHLTRYSFCRKGGLFDQMPLKAAEGLTPRKSGLPTEKYGGYAKSTASFYVLASYMMGKKRDIMFVPVELMFADKVLSDADFSKKYISDTISEINGGKPVGNVELLLNGRPIKINSVLSLDGLRVMLRGKLNGGALVIISPISPLILGEKMNNYVKVLENFAGKRQKNAGIMPDSEHDHIYAENNIALYAILHSKLYDSVFKKCPGNIGEALAAGEDAFKNLSVDSQVTVLLNIIAWFSKNNTCNLSEIGGKQNGGSKYINAKLSNISKNYKDVRLIDISHAGLYESRSENLLELL